MTNVVVGYSGGKASHWPTYKSIGDYTEAVRIEYDPTVITYRGMLEKYFDMVGDDVFYNSAFGNRQYRNALFVHTPEQQAEAQQMLEEVSQRKGGRKAYVAIEPATDFYRAGTCARSPRACFPPHTNLTQSRRCPCNKQRSTTKSTKKRPWRSTAGNH